MTFLVARGTTGRLSSRQASCDTQKARPAGIVQFDAESRSYKAVAAGRVEVPCADADLVFDVRPVARIEVNGPAKVRVGDKLSLVIRAFDAKGDPLLVGEDDAVDWQFSGALAARDYPGCGDMVPNCMPRNSGYATARAAGKGEATAVLGGIAARLTVVVTPWEDEGPAREGSFR